MRQKILVVSLFAVIGVLFTACQAKEVVQHPAATEESVLPEQLVTIEPTEFIQATETIQPTLSFDRATYTDEYSWIAMDYPAGWATQPLEKVGERGWQGGLFSPGSTAEALAEGGSRVMITLYIWDPKGDIEAYTARRKLAWEASGFQVLEENSKFMTDDRMVVTFEVETSTGEKVIFAFLTTGDDYLELSAEGDLELCREIINTLRPID